MKYEIKYKELTDYLKTLKDKDFQRNWNKNPDAPMKEGHPIMDIEFFKMDKSKITLIASQGDSRWLNLFERRV